jgi:hypothetical protein
VLLIVSEWVRGKTVCGLFTFDKDQIKRWLGEARELCVLCDQAGTLEIEEQYFRGTAFCATDVSTHWTEPYQLFTWWKNNVERRSKYKVLQDDAAYVGDDPRLSSRSVSVCYFIFKLLIRL